MSECARCEKYQRVLEKSHIPTDGCLSYEEAEKLRKRCGSLQSRTEAMERIVQHTKDHGRRACYDYKPGPHAGELLPCGHCSACELKVILAEFEKWEDLYGTEK